MSGYRLSINLSYERKALSGHHALGRMLSCADAETWDCVALEAGLKRNLAMLGVKRRRRSA